jgi:hypothetical protein
MVNGSDVFVCLVTGLAIPLAIVDGFRALAGPSMPAQPTGLYIKTRLLVWLFALIAGPGLLAERMLSAWREGELALADRVNALVITLGWGALYGYVVLRLAHAAIPI